MHREFRSVIASRDATRLDRSSAPSTARLSASPCAGWFDNAAKEYSRVRRKLGGEGAQVEQYLLQGWMKVALARPDAGISAAHPSRRCCALPGGRAAGSTARDIAAEIAALAGGQGIEEAAQLEASQPSRATRRAATRCWAAAQLAAGAYRIIRSASSRRFRQANS